MELRIGQINAQRSSAAAAELEILIKEFKLDILCIQEPYSFRNLVRGYNSPNLRIVQPSCKTPWVAAVVRYENLNVLVFPDTSEHVIYFQVSTSACSFYVINVYCQFSIQISHFLDLINNILAKIKGKKFVITLDSNSKSEAWFSRETDERGKLVEEFILANDLIILNEPNNPPTFMNSCGQSNIDITLISSNFARFIVDWKVITDCTSSDHNLIIFKIELSDKNLRNSNLNKVFNIKKPFNLKRANWEGFEHSVKSKFNDHVKEMLKNSKPDKAVNAFNRLLTQCCDENIPKKCIKERSVPWWSEDIKRLRSETNKYKKQLQRARRLNFNDLIPEYELKFRIMRNKYVAKIRKTKKDTWKSFVTDVGNRDPWSMVYKIIRNKINKDEFLSSLRLPSGELTMSWQETVKKLLEKCVPKDEIECETDEQIDIKRSNNLYYNCNLEPDITVEEIMASIKKCKMRRAPGEDRFQSDLILKLMHVDGLILFYLFNNCMRNCIFPDEWKRANLKIILKDPLRDKSLLSSYRPIALLSSVGKIFERIIVGRIQINYKNRNLENDKQYGFRQHKSTDDALVALKTGIENTNKKYVLIIFIDIEAAFDSLWWPTIIARVIKAECSTVLTRLIKSYFKNRNMIVNSRFESVKSRMQKGCPQGSVIGPVAWGWCLDTFLDLFQAEINDGEGEIVAYADDLAMIIKGNSRLELEATSNKGLEILNKWCAKHKLKISISKTKAMLLKGKLDKERLPIIKINNIKVKYSDKIKYLGVIVDDKLNFVSHAKYIRSKVVNLIMALKRVTRDTWGLKSNIINVLYSAVFLPIVNYGSGLWFREVQKTHVMRHLLATQRSILLLLTKACRTTSTVALQVLAGVLPLDLSIIRQVLISKIKRNKTIKWKSYSYLQKENLQIANESKRIKDETDIIEKMVYDEWQERWSNETKGRDTFSFIQNVRFKINNKWFNPNRFCVYLITSYGPINSTLYKRKCVENKNCLVCNLDEEEDVNHILFKCPTYHEFRYMEILNLETDKSTLIETKEKFEKLSKFIVKAFDKRRKVLTELESSGSASTLAGTGNVGQGSDG